MRSILIAVVLAFTSFFAQVTNGAIDFSGSYSQNFDTLASSGTGNAWANDSTIAGWHLFQHSGGEISAYDAGSGTGTTGSFYSFGSAAGERALGGVGAGATYFASPASGARAGYIAIALRNTSGTTYDGLVLQWSGEQWRNSAAAAQTMELEYGFGDTFSTVDSWFATGSSFDFTSPVSGGTAGEIDGNVAGKIAGLGGVISGISWLDNQTLWLRWIEVNDTGNDHGLGIDDFAITVVPEPAEWGLICVAGLLGVCGLHSWRERRRTLRHS